MRSPYALALVIGAASTVAALASPAEAASRAYAARGSLDFQVKDLDASTQLVVPKTGGPFPLVVASHGFSASGKNQLGWAQQWASWGFVVAVPSFPSPLSPNHAGNASIIESLVANLQGAGASANKVKPGAFGLEGHSAGALSTTLAAAKVSPAAVVLFDPVDNGGLGKAAYAKLCSPVLGVFAGASACNQQGQWASWAPSMPGERTLFSVVGSTHCDGENQPRTLCSVGCGGAADADRQATYAHYATAFFLAKLAGDAAAAAVLAEANLDGDAALSGASFTATTCSPGPGGATTTSSSSSSSGDVVTTPSPQQPEDGASSGGGGESASPDAGDGGGGCAAARAGATPERDGTSALVVAALGLGLVVARRRHARG